MLIKGKFSSAKRKSLTIVLLSIVCLNNGLSQTNYSPLYTSANFIKTINLTRPVGTVDGAAGTTTSGGSTYTIPIYAPPGTNGIQPAISIVYNSQGGPGVAGYGWSISGLSVISRTGKNLYHSTEVSSVNYTSTNDAFLLDGMKLNPISGNNGANGTVYATEAETFAVINSWVGNGNADNPDWFKVTGKDGSVMEFGNTSDSRIMSDDGLKVMMWRLNRIVDISGNYVDFKYINIGRDTRIDEINYTGNINSDLPPYNKIKFNYGGRYDQNTIYEGGASLSTSYLLNNISISAGTDDIVEQVKKYQFNYGFDNINSLLKEVEEYGAGLQSPPLLNSTIFLYGDQPQNTVTQSTIEFNGECLTGDFNADGKTDIVGNPYHYQGNNTNLKFSEGYKIYLDPTSTTIFSEKTFTDGDYIVAEKKNLGDFLTGDYNRDGRDDIFYVKTQIVTYPSGNVERILENLKIDLTTATGSVTTQVPMPPGNIIHQSGIFLISGDFDGDGSQDYITILRHSSSSWWYAYICAPAKVYGNYLINTFTVTPGTDWSATSIASADNVLPFDFDGDGKQEVLVVKGSQTYVLNITSAISGGNTTYSASIVLTTSEISVGYRIFPGDFNGDRKVDLLVRQTNGNWKVLTSTGVGFLSTPYTFNQAVNMQGQYTDDKIVVADFNGDGKSDILHGFQIWSGGTFLTSKFSVYYSKGVVFYNEIYDYPFSLPYIDLSRGDFNGDGRSDLLLKQSYTSSANIVYFKPNGKETLLAKVTDGHNTTSSFEYKLLTDKTSTPYVYNRTVSLDDPANQSPFNYVQMPMYAVSSVSEPDGIGGINTTSFYYEDAVVHRYAKGFLGFKKVTAINANSGVTAFTESQVNTQFATPFVTKQTSKLTSTGSTINESTITNSFVDLSTGANDKRYFQKIDKTLSVDQLNGRASESVNTYDNYGNVIVNVSKTGTPSGTTVNPVETTTTTTTFGIHNTTVPAKPDNVTVSNTRAGMPSISATSTFTYTTNGLPATQTAFYGLPKAVTTSYTYNGFGNVTQTVTSSAGLSNRTSQAIYDSRGRFPITKKAVGASLTQTESLTYDNKWGKPLTYTSTDCLNTSFVYDAFGRLITTNMPEGYAVSNSLVWDIQGQQVYYSFTDYPGGKPDSKTWFDKLDRPIKNQVMGFNNQWLMQLTTYNSKGNLLTKTNSYYSGETPLVTTNSYDNYNRPISISNLLATVTTAYTNLGNGQVKVTTQNSAGQSQSKTTDAAGKVINAIDNGGQLDFTYDSWGNQLETKHGTLSLVISTYDAYGRQISLLDKNAGLVTYQYDAYGQLTQQTDANNNTYTMVYDDLGRLTTRTGTEGVTSYEYFKVGKSGVCNNNNISKVTGFNGVIKQYTFDALRRPLIETVTVDGTSNTTTFSYDAYSNLASTLYPSGVVVNNIYDANGGLQSITGGDNSNPVTLFTAGSVNGSGQYTSYTLGNGKTTQNTYNYGIPTRFYTPGIQDLNFSFDNVKGNLNSRNDALKGVVETFQYDNLNRLTTSTVNGVQQLNINYDGSSSFSMGNITSKTDAGNYVYSNNRIHAVNYITNPAGPTAPPVTMPTTQQQITYTPFLKTATVTEGPNIQTNFTYGPDYQRIKSEQLFYGSISTTKYYFGDYERIISGSYTRDVVNVNTGNNLCIIEKPQGGGSIFHYVYTDYLGSLLTRTDNNGTVDAEQNFDAWGRLRDPNNWQYLSYTTPYFFDRGYTGHEHMPYHHLINMNGRMYDPIQGRMLSPDNYVPDPWHTQGYNRYSYANNNPLIFKDPDGNLLVPIIAGAIIGGFFKGVQYDKMGKSFLGGFWRGAIAGGVTGAFTFIGGGTFVKNVVTGIAQGIVSNGLNNVLDNKPFFKGAVEAGLIAGTFAAITSMAEAVRNIEDGYDFGTDHGIFNRLFKDARGAAGVDPIKAQAALDFWNRRFGGAHMLFDQAESAASTSPLGVIRIGPSKFTTANNLRRSIVHEQGHYFRDLLWANNRPGGTSLGIWRDNTGAYNNDGSIAYNFVIRYSGRFNIPLRSLLNDPNQLSTQQAFKSFGFFGYWYNVPHRFHPFLFFKLLRIP